MYIWWQDRTQICVHLITYHIIKNEKHNERKYITNVPHSPHNSQQLLSSKLFFFHGRGAFDLNTLWLIKGRTPQSPGVSMGFSKVIPGEWRRLAQPLCFWRETEEVAAASDSFKPHSTCLGFLVTAQQGRSTCLIDEKTLLSVFPL